MLLVVLAASLIQKITSVVDEGRYTSLFTLEGYFRVKNQG